MAWQEGRKNKMKRMIAVGILAAMLAAVPTSCDGVSGEMAENGFRPSAGADASGNDVSTEDSSLVEDGKDKEEVDVLVTPVAEGEGPYTVDTRIEDVVNDPVFGDYGRLIFPVNDAYYRGGTLGELGLTWYSHIDPDATVAITNYMYLRAEAGDTIFYDIYTGEEKEADPDKRNTGLFFFRGTPGEKFAVCNAGGGFAYVGAMHDSFPHALALSQEGYNAFALIYRPGAQTACEDLARAISFIFEHAEELCVDTDCYSLWGGSAGARMAAWLGTYGPAAFGGDDLPQPGTVIMQYTGHSEYSEADPPTYACVGENDGIASWRTMRNRLQRLEGFGIDTEFHSYPGLGHSFGLGTGTVAQGWFQDAVAFWEKQMGR